MLRKIVNVVVVLPLAVLFVGFAVANRHAVTVSFDPFDSTDPSLGVTLPLFAVVILVAILGVIAGGVATWFGQRHWRKAARQHEAEARHARAELAELRERTMAARTGEAQVPALASGRPPAVGGRDNSGATL